MVAPKLRFKEFDRDWTTQSLGNVTDITKLAGYEFTKHINYQDSGEIIALRGLNVKGNNLVLEDVKYIDNSDLSMLSRSKLYIDDLLFTYVGTIGEVALIPENDKFYLAPNVCRIRRVNKNILSKYLMFLFSNENFKKNQIDKYTTKSSQPALSMENIRKFEIVFPSVEEQTKIASFLSAVDEKISQLTQKHELLSQYKQGMMQKLFSQQIRFKADDGGEFGEWEEKNILKIADVSIGLVTTMTTNYREKGTPLIRNSDIKPNNILKNKLIFLDSDFADSYENRKLKVNDIVTVHTGDVGVSSLIPEELNGAIGFATINTRVIDENVSPCYLVWYFNSKKFINWCVNYSTGDGRQNLNLKDFNTAVIPLPSLEEQTKIANLLSAIDQKVEVVAQQIEQAKLWKKGLLQQMFV